MWYFRALVFSLSFLLPLGSAGANVLTPADYQNYQDLDVKMLSIGDDLYALMTTRADTNTPDCLMELAFKFDAVQADLHRIRTLVGIGASMTDNTDEMRVIRQLNLAAWGFIEQLKYHRLILSSIGGKCNEKEVGTKGQEIARAWNEAAALIQSTIKKIGASSP